MRAKIGSSFGTRWRPRVRFRKGRSGLWWLKGRAYRTRRAAFRAARRLRDETGGYHAVLRLPPRPGRKLPEFYVAVRREKAA